MNTEQSMMLADTYALERNRTSIYAPQTEKARAELEAAITTLVQERDALKDENRLLRDALMKACGDDEDSVNICIESQRS